VLVLAGLRVGELCGLRWRDVDLAGGWLHIGEAKADAGRGQVKVRGIVRDALLAIKPADADPDSFVIATSTGGRKLPPDVRQRAVRAGGEPKVIMAEMGHTDEAPGLRADDAPRRAKTSAWRRSPRAGFRQLLAFLAELPVVATVNQQAA
jgi:integrase